MTFIAKITFVLFFIGILILMVIVNLCLVYLTLQ